MIDFRWLSDLEWSMPGIVFAVVLYVIVFELIKMVTRGEKK